jgi:hypothetical protein
VKGTSDGHTHDERRGDNRGGIGWFLDRHNGTERWAAEAEAGDILERARSARDQATAHVVVPSRSWADHYAAGKALRTTCPPDAHAAWKAQSTRPDAVELILAAEKGRMQDLLPLRHGRMVKSAFTFCRGAISVSLGGSRVASVVDILSRLSGAS